MKNKPNLNPACACHIYLINNIMLICMNLFLNCVFKGVKSPI
jgi:hypothetical protein